MYAPTPDMSSPNHSLLTMPNRVCMTEYREKQSLELAYSHLTEVIKCEEWCMMWWYPHKLFSIVDEYKKLMNVLENALRFRGGFVFQFS